MNEYYGTEDGFFAYTDARAYDVPNTDPVAALIRATTWMDANFRARLPGSKVGGRAQPLEWPRKYATDLSGEEIAEDEVPEEWLAAVYEAALREMRSPGALSPDVVVGRVKQSVSVAGAVSVTYATTSGGVVVDQRPVLTVVEDLVSGLLTAKRNGSGYKFVERA